MTDSNTTRRLYAAALVGIILYVVLDAIVQSLPPHYSPISQAESDLAVGPFGYIMTVNFLDRGLLSFAFLAAFAGSVKQLRLDAYGFRTGMVLLGVWSVGAILLAIFPTDVPATPVTLHGLIHLVVALFAFLGGALGALAVSLRMRKVEALRRIRGQALAVACVSVFLCLLDLLERSISKALANDYGGLIERLFLGSVLLWIAIVSGYFVTREETPAAPVAEPRIV